ISEEDKNRWLLVIVGLPLLAAYALRFPFPDSSFDVWGLRLFHGERALRGYLYWPGEFFPTAAPFNPTPDMITSIFRHALGYRLGTIVNLLVLIWTATFIDKLLRPYVSGDKLRSVGVLLVVFAEQILFEINNYMPDLLALPLLLEATRLTLNAREKEFEPRVALRVALLLGMAVGLKLSNGAVAVPIVIVWIWRALRFRTLNAKQLTLLTFAAAALFFSPFLSFMIWVYRATGSPIYPLYNKVFRSPLYPPFIGWDDRWGGYGVWEILTWPVIMFFQPVRASELPVYSGRLSLAFIVSVFCILFRRHLDQRTRLTTFIFVLGTLLWSVTMGYIRYGLYLEVLSGILLIGVCALLLSQRVVTRWRTVLASTIAILMVAQMALATVYLLRTEWSLRPTVFTSWPDYKRETQHLFWDRSIRALVEPDDVNALDNVDVWIVSGIKMAGLLPFLNDKAPCVSVRFLGLLLAPANRAALAKTLEHYRDEQMWSMVLQSDYNDALFALHGAGLKVVEIKEFNIPFFAKEDTVPTYFFRVVQEKTEIAQPPRTKLEDSSNVDTGAVTLTAMNPPVVIGHDTDLKLYVNLMNSSQATLPSLTSSDGQKRLRLIAYWTKDGAQVGKSLDTSLPYDFLPGESAILPLPIRTPTAAAEYTLSLKFVSEAESTIARTGNKTVDFRVQVVQ
ncbi:MAG TPA: hypothetical protein VFH91_04705, partial [Pyrinomonadaceae bacterium]|nr:hypothetical protein [Pyrinomonadaceae bacterium]